MWNILIWFSLTIFKVYDTFIQPEMLAQGKKKGNRELGNDMNIFFEFWLKPKENGKASHG